MGVCLRKRGPGGAGPLVFPGCVARGLSRVSKGGKSKVEKHLSQKPFKRRVLPFKGL
ncbi:hypothetical protein CGSHi7P49H1_02799 [Haemophilus influenzae 7P49H1]|nr:hypothetical protein CGSHi7P49H1_02799 [Haemophilus influenzae 7P49H1]